MDSDQAIHCIRACLLSLLQKPCVRLALYNFHIGKTTKIPAYFDHAWYLLRFYFTNWDQLGVH
jgi:hypothetical protein